MTPKSLLRHKRAVSDLADMAEGSSFHRVLHDDAEAGADVDGVGSSPTTRSAASCSARARSTTTCSTRGRRRAVDDVYILRLEQFYPWPMKSLSDELARFTNAELVWCQEEPKNMGGWTFVDPWLELTLAKLKHQGQARPLRRPPGLGLHGRRPDEPPPEGTRSLPRPKPSPDTDSTLEHSTRSASLWPTS